MQAQQQTVALRVPRISRFMRPRSCKVEFKKFYLSMDELGHHSFGNRAKTTEGYVGQVYRGWTLCSVYVVQRIKVASNGKIPSWYLRPDIFDRLADAPRMK